MMLTVDALIRAKELMMDSSGPVPQTPTYIAPTWVYDDPELLRMFTIQCQIFHPGETVEIIRQVRL